MKINKEIKKMNGIIMKKMIIIKKIESELILNYISILLNNGN